MSHPAAAADPTSRSVAILGADALLAARPCTPAQLANACIAVGFSEVFPATWGDELIAAGCLERLERRTGSAIFCACPRAAEQLRGEGELREFVVPLISPPVAVARYLRALFPGTSLAITYVGECPGAEDDAIDERLSPRELLARLEQRGITIAAQNTELAAKAHDRRRFHSIPGGAPHAGRLGEQSTKRTLVDVHASAGFSSLAREMMSSGSALMNVAPQLGCACAGAVNGESAYEARAAVVALEPPRAQSEIVDASVRVRVSLPSARDRDRTDVTWDDFLAALPTTMSMHGEGATAPFARTGRRAAPRRMHERKGALPRAYLAARRGVLEGARRDQQRARVARHRPDDTHAAPARPVSVGLTRGDRWLLAGLMLGGSLLVAVLTSTLTVQGIEHTRATSLASSKAPSAAVHADSLAAVAATRIAASRDSTPILASTPEPVSTSVASASQIDSAPRHADLRAAPPAPRRASVRTDGRALTVAEHVRSAPQPRPVASRRSIEASAIAPQTLPELATPPAATPPSPAPASVAPASVAPASVAPATGAPVAASAANNALVLEELRAIHAEIDARKRHVDSLTASLDSLKRGTTPE